MTVLSIALKILISIIVVAVGLLFFFQSKLLFHPVKLEKDFAFKFTLPHEEKFYSYNGKAINGVLFKAAHPRARLVFFHGNVGALDTWGQVGADLCEKFSSDVLVLDYPGFGKSEGDVPSIERAMYESAELAFDDFTVTTDQNLPVIVYGRSLGSAVASYLASKKTVQGLILETPYTSMKAMAAHVLPFVPSFLVRYDLDNEKNIKDLKIPILVMHGTADQVIPYVQGQQLAAVNAKAEFVTFDNGGHNNLKEYPLYWESVEKIINAVAVK